MRQDSPSKWESPIFVSGIVALFLIVVFGSKAVLGDHLWGVVFAIIIGLGSFWLGVDAYRHRGDPSRGQTPVDWLSWTLILAGAVVTASGSNDVGVPMLLLGLGLALAADRVQKRRHPTEP